jgi:hypothetical protein
LKVSSASGPSLYSGFIDGSHVQAITANAHVK